MSPVRIYCSGAVVSQSSVAYKEIEMTLSSSDVATEGSDYSSCSGWCLAEDNGVFFPLDSLFPANYKLVVVFSKLFH